MTDKQEIIINGVDVKRCEFLFPHNKYNGCRCMNDPIANVSNVSSMSCEGNPNCYYKQLQRKTAECEELHTELKFKVEYIQEQREVIKDLEKNLR